MGPGRQSMGFETWFSVYWALGSGMVNVLVTGGCGFIGSALLRHLLSNDEFDGKVMNVDKLTYAANPRSVASVENDDRYSFERIDIADLEAVERTIGSFEPDIIIHLAAETHVDRSIEDPFDFVKTNVLGTSHLLHCSLERANSSPGFRFIHVSTDEVYGSMQDGESAKEGDPYRPNSPYAASKAASDHMVRAWHSTYGMPVITTNCTNNYGPWQYPEKLIPVMVLNALKGSPLPVYGDGGNVRDWLYVEDHASAIWRVACGGQIGETYNISGRAELTNLELVRTICSELDESIPRADGKSYSTQIELVADRPGHDRRYSLDSEKIERALEWRPSLSFEAGLRQTINWYIDHEEELTKSTESAFATRRGLIR